MMSFAKVIAAVFVLTLVHNVIGTGLRYPTPPLSIGTFSTVEKLDLITRKSIVRSGTVAMSAQEPSFQSMLFVGDVLLARNVEYIMRYQDPFHPFNGVTLSSLAHEPAIIGNFESSIPLQHQPTPLQQLQFSTDVAFVPYLKQAGFSHLSLANNHSFDFGEEAYRNTREQLHTTMQPFGHPHEIGTESVVYLTVDGVRVALLGLHAFETEIVSDKTQLLVENVSQISDVQIAYVHWGEEYERTHSDTQRLEAEALVAAGVDLIIGHHPHVIQGVDLIHSVPVFYSLGNYIFDQYFSSAVQTGLVLGVTFNAGLEVHLHTVSSEETISQPQLQPPRQHSETLYDIALRSHPDLADQVKRGVITIDTDEPNGVQYVHAYDSWTNPL